MRLVIVGATHIGQILADIAQRIDYDVIVVDPRTAFALDVSGCAGQLAKPFAVSEFEVTFDDWDTSVPCMMFRSDTLNGAPNMGKNVVIFSDGTGQVGGYHFGYERSSFR